MVGGYSIVHEQPIVKSVLLEINMDEQFCDLHKHRLIHRSLWQRVSQLYECRRYLQNMEANSTCEKIQLLFSRSWIEFEGLHFQFLLREPPGNQVKSMVLRVSRLKICVAFSQFKKIQKVPALKNYAGCHLFLAANIAIRFNYCVISS